MHELWKEKKESGMMIIIVLTGQRWDLWEAFQNLQRRERQLRPQSQGCSHLEAAEVAETDHPGSPSLTIISKQTNQELKATQQQIYQ